MILVLDQFIFFYIISVTQLGR